MGKREQVSEREYARRRGCAHSAVQYARKSGRLSKSVTRDAKGRIRIDPALADAEWAATTKSDRVPLTGPTAPGGPTTETPTDLAEARLRHEAAKAALAELDLAEKRGELVAVSEIDARLAGEYARAKTKLLGIPSKMRQRDPAFTLEQIALLEALVREVLNDLASEDDPPVREVAT